MFVQFSDDKKSQIIAVFSCPQDSAEYPNQGEVEETDPRYQAFIAPPTVILDPVAKLKSFLNANPDVAKLLSA